MVGSTHHQLQRKSKKLKSGAESLPSSKKIMTDLNDTNTIRVSMEVIVAIVSKLVYFKYLRDASNLLIYGWNNPFTTVDGWNPAPPEM